MSESSSLDVTHNGSAAERRKETEMKTQTQGKVLDRNWKVVWGSGEWSAFFATWGEAAEYAGGLKYSGWEQVRIEAA